MTPSPGEYSKSLSFKLLLAFLATVFLTALGLMIIYWTWYESHAEEYVLQEQLSFVVEAIQDIETPLDYDVAARIARYSGSDIYIVEGDSDRVWSSHGEAPPLDLTAIEYWPVDEGAIQRKSRLAYGYSVDSAMVFRSINDLRTIYIKEDLNIGGYPVLSLYVRLSLLVVCGLFAYYLLVRKLFSPLKMMSGRVKGYSSGDLSQRIGLERVDEIGHLAKQLDVMADEIQSMLDAKRNLLLAISHELRTPITRANVSLAMMPISPLVDEVKDDIREVEAMISGLLEGEKLNAPHRPLNVTDVLVSDLLSEVVVGYTSETVRFHGAVDNLRMKVDEVRLQLLFKNLIDNALHYSLKGEGFIPVALEAFVERDGLTVEVKDQGVGIAPEHLSKITEPFYRADFSRQRESGGYGLGLYLCKAIVEAHGGQLLIESRLGEGTVVKVILPT